MISDQRLQQAILHGKSQRRRERVCACDWPIEGGSRSLNFIIHAVLDHRVRKIKKLQSHNVLTSSLLLICRPREYNFYLKVND